MTDTAESEITFENQHENKKMTIHCDFNETSIEFDFHNDMNLKELRCRIHEERFGHSESDELIRARMKMYRPLFWEQAIDLEFDDSEKVIDVLQMNDGGLYEVFVALAKAGSGSKHENLNHDDELYVESEGDDIKHVIVGTESSFQTFKVSDTGTHVKLNRNQKSQKRFKAEQWPKVKKSLSNRHVSTVITNN